MQVCSREEGQAALARARELIEERMRDKMAKSKEWQGQADLTAEVLRQDIDKKMNPRVRALASWLVGAYSGNRGQLEAGDVSWKRL